MGAMTDPTSRALRLLGLLEARAVWTGAELAERLGVTSRTLRRDVDRLRTLGYVVEADPGPGGGYALGRGQVVPPLLLDEDQAVAVTLALTRAAHAGDGVAAESALRALATLDALMPADLRHRLEGLRAASTVGAGDGPPVGPELLACADAVRRRVRLTFGYRDRRGARTERRVEPHRLVARARAWLLVAHDLDRDDWRTFRVDRIVDPAVGTWAFTPRPDLAEALARLDEPTPPEAWRHRVSVRVHAPLESVRASLPAAAGRLTALDARTTAFETGADDPAEAARWLALLGHEFEVLGDEPVRAAVAALADRLHRSTVQVLRG